MVFALPDHWVWDFWLADDGRNYHLFFLHAPKSLANPDLRHRNARIGHATSADLVQWTHHGLALPAGEAGTFDGTATWTGTVVRGPDRLWRMFYTGARFLETSSNANVETVGLAVSADLFSWAKRPGPVVVSDPHWYETLGTSEWPEEAWRDPWVFADPSGDVWHMLLTARANHGATMQRGVIGHATSTDLDHWKVQPPLSAIGMGFAHLEVPQIVTIEDRTYLIFSCDTPRLTGHFEGRTGGVWYLEVGSPTGPFRPDRARLLAPQRLYAGRLVQHRNGDWALMAFDSTMTSDGQFAGVISNPIPILVGIDGRLSIDEMGTQ